MTEVLPRQAHWLFHLCLVPHVKTGGGRQGGRTDFVSASRAGCDTASRSLVAWFASWHTSLMATSSTCSSKGSGATSCR